MSFIYILTVMTQFLTYIVYVTLLTFYKIDNKMAFAGNLLENCKYLYILLAKK